MNQNVIKLCQNVCLEFTGPGELFQFESQDNEKDKIINFRPFSFTLKMNIFNS